MKYYRYYYIIIFCCVLFLCNKKGEAQNIKLNFKASVDVDLLQVYKIQQGARKLVGEFTLKKDEEKCFTDTCTHAFYMFKYNKMFKKMYVRTGQHIKLEVKANAIHDIKPTEENKLIEEWYNISTEVRQLSVTYNDNYMKKLVRLIPFYEAQRQLEKESKPFLKKLEGRFNDPYFGLAMSLLVNAEINYFKLYNKQIPVISARIKQLPEDLYNSIRSSERLNNNILLDVFEDTNSYVHLYGAWNQGKDRMNGKPSVEYVNSPEIQVAYLVYLAKFYKDGRGLKVIERKYLDLFKSGYALEQLKELQKENSLKADNTKLSKINLKNGDGEIVKLLDFTGKLLVIDVWATWCGPCMRSRPAFEKLAHDMAGEDVTFMAISIDKSEMAWKKVASKSDFIELLDHDRMFANAYGISSVPHFMIFDSKGTLLDAPAPSPANGALKQKIVNYLSK